ncbi:hypothetical protein JVU11DRAFT_928 [Chiua virens]|nr:hypothetical protein JVU11DRAFT_928 [Chiua virens]
MPPRRTGQTSPHLSTSKGKKGKGKAIEGSAGEASHSGSDGSQSGRNPRNTYWSLEDEHYFLQYVQTNKAMMGEGFSFKQQFWSEVADQFPKPVRGKGKTAKTCKDKWGRMKKTFSIVHKIATTSGLAYSLEKGADIKPESPSQQIWDDIIKVLVHLCSDIAG